MVWINGIQAIYSEWFFFSFTLLNTLNHLTFQFALCLNLKILLQFLFLGVPNCFSLWLLKKKNTCFLYNTYKDINILINHIHCLNDLIWTSCFPNLLLCIPTEIFFHLSQTRFTVSQISRLPFQCVCVYHFAAMPQAFYLHK